MFLFHIWLLHLLLWAQVPQTKPVSLFDGKTFTGWEGDTLHTWHVTDSSFTGGPLLYYSYRDEVLATQHDYKNFVLQLQFKVPDNNFAHAGVHFRSQRTHSPFIQMIGYEARLGEGFWGNLQDNIRRNKTLGRPDTAAMNKILIRNDWNNLRIHCQGQRMRIWINELQTANYVEKVPSFPQYGKIALQIYYRAEQAQVAFKNINIEELP